MTRTINLSDLDRRALENLILAEHGLLRRVLEAVREYTEDDWRVRREVERVVDEYQDRRPILYAIVRTKVTSLERSNAERNAERWLEFMAGSAPGKSTPRPTVRPLDEEGRP